MSLRRLCSQCCANDTMVEFVQLLQSTPSKPASDAPLSASLHSLPVLLDCSRCLESRFSASPSPDRGRSCVARCGARPSAVLRVLHHGILFSLVASWLPMITSALTPIWTFLRLRRVDRTLSGNILGPMAKRIVLIGKGMNGYANVQRIGNSGFLRQCWAYFEGTPDHPRSDLQRERLIIGCHGLPDGMTQAYFDKKVKEAPYKLGRFGGKLHL